MTVFHTVENRYIHFGGKIIQHRHQTVIVAAVGKVAEYHPGSPLKCAGKIKLVQQAVNAVW